MADLRRFQSNLTNSTKTVKEMCSLVNIKDVDQKTKDIVFGYIHRMESSLNFELIPPLVSHLCLLFYYIQEFFAQIRNDYFKLSQNKLKVTNISQKGVGFDHSILLNKWIDSTSKCIVKWTFIVNDICQGFSHPIGIGLTSIDKGPHHDFANANDKPNYAIYLGTQAYKNNHFVDRTSHHFFVDKKAIFVLDLQKKTFGYHNEKKGQFITVFTNIETSPNIKYKMVIQMKRTGTELTLIHHDHYIPDWLIYFHYSKWVKWVKKKLKKKGTWRMVTLEAILILFCTTFYDNTSAQSSIIDCKLTGTCVINCIGEFCPFDLDIDNL